MKNRLLKPEWLKKKIEYSEEYHELKKFLRRSSLNTVCEEARCPNICECFKNKTATFMILGSVCSRNCSFCAIDSKDKSPIPIEKLKNEPLEIAQAVNKLKLKHVVITSVTRDDLPDQGVSQFKKTIKAINNANPNISIEILTPDFSANKDILEELSKESFHIFNHNIETVKRLYKEVRPQAIYERSLKVLSLMASLNKELIIKSGFMLGLGEKEDEVIKLLEDLYNASCSSVTIGQYLRPSLKNYEVSEYVKEEKFIEYEMIAKRIGFKYVFSAPYVRSSYMAGL
ncbi:MAG: lipoyl synthase [Pseudomonadota bacterium]